MTTPRQRTPLPNPSVMGSFGKFILALLALGLAIKMWYITVPVLIFAGWYRFFGPGKVARQ